MSYQSNLEVFSFEEQDVRFVGTPDAPEWIAVDVCNVLTIANYRDALSDFDDDQKGVVTIDTPGGKQQLLTVTEPGLYRLIFKSRKPIAKRFQRWVFQEVLPSIRSTGSYSIKKQSEAPALPSLRERRERLEIIQLGIDIISQLGGIDERTQLAFKDLTKNIVLEDQLKKPALPSSGRFEWPVSDRAMYLGYGSLTKAQLQRIGRAAARLYRARYNQDPPKREQFVDGATRLVNCYEEKDLEILDSAINLVVKIPALPPSSLSDENLP
jgi:prophage antirepressor-like protein